MSNPKHLEILKKGAFEWNKLRKVGKIEVDEPTDTPKFTIALPENIINVQNPDFSNADLSGFNLEFANLSNANLSGANLSGANLYGANLSGADLSNANLTEANLAEADLSKAILWNAILVRTNLTGVEAVESDFYEADLSFANFSNAFLNSARLQKSNLKNINFSGSDLSYSDFSGSDLSESNLTNSDFYKTDLSETILFGADMSNSDLVNANLSNSDLSGTRFIEADLSWANLSWVNLAGADLSKANLHGTLLINTVVDNIKINKCRVYGVNIWDCKGEILEQEDLIITPDSQQIVTVDNIKIAQFIYLLLENKEIRDAIDTLTSKAVLILGRFTEERKAVLDVIKDELRSRNYLPILFDFDKPASKDLTETIMTLASISKFIIADVTDAKSIPQELSHVVPHLPSLAVAPIILESQRQYAMFEHFQRYPWVLPVYEYPSKEDLLTSLNEKVIDPAEMKAKELKPKPLN